MKLFQQLLVAPAALGLMAPLAANAADLNIDGISDYTSGSEVQSFSDVYPTDWAYQALTSLAERHGCAVANPSGSITRYEAASLLNKCLGNVAQVNEEERRLINEFAPELAVIKGRIDGLEARVGEFEAGQFSNTTKLDGKANIIVGQVDSDADTSDSTTMEYSYQMNLNSSFSGRDNLYVRIKTGNVQGHFGTRTSATYLSAHGAGSAEAGGSSATAYDYLKVDKLWYSFPVAEQFKVWIGPKVENYYMLASSPSIYKPVMKQFALGGNGPVYGSSTNPGLGVAWTQQKDDPSAARFAVSLAYTQQSGESAAVDSGIFGETGKRGTLVKFEYGSPRWQVSLATAYKSGGWTDTYFATNQAAERATHAHETAYGLRAYWKPEEVGAIPAIQIGYDTTTIDNNDVNVKEADGWMIGLMWDDVGSEGNKAGFAIGSRMTANTYHATLDETATAQSEGAKDNSTWEAYYTFQVNDNVSVTPAFFGSSDPNTGTNDDANGYVVLTTLKF
ncbi:iron uptake porin [Prochlorococcus sp. MIT 1223]|uniref:iron uptake porin n=1 Tax=Prochlorococcus sp. MIT 1223 TaxID=3096217 RepID=UPI002A75CFAA|nr:iron uptake porin [Prochlorococcus sp. MIT 1223]